MSLPRPQSQIDPAKPAFIIGVIGHMDIDIDTVNSEGTKNSDLIDKALKQIFGWLDHSDEPRNQALPEDLELTDTPLILLSSLAPGADQWVVKIARTIERPAGLRILAPLPFLKDQYLEASTFKRGGAMVNEDASKFLADFPDQDVFVVRMRDEVDLDDDELRRRHSSILTGPEKKGERDRRYAAAGRYIAAYSDILIALTDKPIGKREKKDRSCVDSPSARAIAELKRKGVPSDGLSVLPVLRWASNGPVIHVYSPRKRKQAPAGSASPHPAESEASQCTDKPGELEMLYPYDCKPSGVSENDNNNREWLKEGHERLKSVAKQLQQFNREKVSDRESQALAEMLPGQGVLPAARESLKAILDPLARSRRRVANWSKHYNACLLWLKRAMFCLAFGVVVFFSLAEHFPEHQFVGDLGYLRPGCFLVALAFIYVIWRIHLIAKEPAKRFDDYRAIAEGLRVQFYWTACGSGKSVASNYLQRQGGELGWIRTLISAIAFPYELCRVWFNQLTLKDRRDVLKSIREKWLVGEHLYFKDQKEQLIRRENRCSAWSTTLVFIGIILLAFICFRESQKPYGIWLLIALSLLCVLLLLCAGGLTLFVRCHQHLRPQRHVLFLAEKLLPNWIQSRWGFAFFCVVIVFALLLAAGATYPERARSLVQHNHRNIAVCKNACFAGGVLFGLWVETNFYKENIRRYDSMASLFEAARVQFGDDFKLLEHLSPDEKDLSPDEKAKAKQAICNLQSLLVAVGREALSENAEWLIEHRARPLRPVSALGPH